MKSELVAKYISSWLDEYLARSGGRGFVIGISGGVDSAVCSTLAATTGRPTLCVTLPIHQPESHVSRAEEHIARLKDRFPNVSSAEADLTVTFETFAAAFPQHPDSGRDGLNKANARSRLRMAALYYFAGLNDALVVGTGNKVEDFGIGFFTKYGDGGVDISPIGGLTKSEVFELAAHLGVPESILRAAPTDGLFGDDRTDEQQIGATYPEIEWAMAQYDNGATAGLFTGRKREVFDIYTSRHCANRHKMVMPPVCEVPKELLGD